MLSLGTIKQYYPNSSEDELKEIQEVVYLFSCAIMQEFYGLEWMDSFEELDQEEK